MSPSDTKTHPKPQESKIGLKMLQSTIVFLASPYPVPPSLYTPTSSSSPLPLPFFCCLSTHSHHNQKHYLGLQWRPRPPRQKRPLVASAATYEVGGGYPDEELDVQDRSKFPRDQGTEKLDPSQCEVILKGGEQVTSVLEEMITLVSSLFFSSFYFHSLIYIYMYIWSARKMVLYLWWENCVSFVVNLLKLIKHVFPVCPWCFFKTNQTFRRRY